MPQRVRVKNDLKPALKTVFQFILKLQIRPSSSDHIDPTQTQAFFIATGNTRREIKIKPQWYCQKGSIREERSNNKLLVVFLFLISREILEGNERPLQVPQHPPECWQSSSLCLTSYTAWIQLFNHIYWPGIVCLSTNCNIWHLVLCMQRVKLCPIKIKISTFIVL